MPYADNMYSADDSDVESFSDELSPTDGYFSQRDHPQDLLVPNPEVNENQSTANSKAQEAQEEASSNTHSISSYRAAPSPLQPSEPSHSFTSPSPSPSPSQSPAVRNSTVTPQTTYIHSSPPQLQSHPSSRNSIQENTSLLSPYIQPPPAYSAAVSQPLVNEQADYNTVSIPQLEEGRSPFPRISEPESMGDPRSFEDERTPLFRRTQNRAAHGLSGRRCLLLTIFLILAVGSIVIGVMTGHSSPRNDRDDVPEGSPDREDKGKDNGGGNHKGGSGDHDGSNSGYHNPNFNRPIASNPPYCSSAIYHVKESSALYALDSKNALNVFQAFDDEKHQDSNNHISTVGEIHIRKAPAGTKDAYITTDFYVSDRLFETHIRQEKHDGYLTVTSPQWVTTRTSITGCISMEITIWLPDYTQITELNIGATTLGIRVFEDAKAYVLRSSVIGTVSGSIAFPGGEPGDDHRVSVRSLGFHLPKLPSFADLIPKLPEYFEHPDSNFSPKEPSDTLPTTPTPDGSETFESSPEPSPHTFSSRDTRVETISGDISGTFQQYDSLILSTKSGNINAYISPQAVLKKAPKPAVLALHTISGRVNAKYDLRSTKSLPLRDYQTDLSTSSAAITGDFIIGSKLYIKTSSGDIDISALPYGILDKGSKADFHTQSISGDTDIVVLDAPASAADIDDPYGAIASKTVYTTLKAHHSATSGHVHVRLPRAFEGLMKLKSVSGSLRVVGDGVRIIHADDRKWGSKSLVAAKGEGDVEGLGDVSLEGISGNMNVEVGRNL